MWVPPSAVMARLLFDRKYRHTRHDALCALSACNPLSAESYKKYGEYPQQHEPQQ